MRLAKELAAWIAQGERGSAADTIVQHLTEIPLCAEDAFGTYPRTPTDLRRCLLLLQTVPTLRPRLHELRALGTQWSAIVQHWHELEELLMAEIECADREAFAPKTYLRLSELLDSAVDQADAIRA